MAQLTGLHIYPIKSAYRLSPASAQVEPWGLTGDRRWMLVDETGRAVTQREEPALGQIRVLPAPDGSLTVTAPDGDRIEVAAPSTAAGDPEVKAEVFGSFFTTALVSAEANAWFAGRFPGVRLVHLDDPLSRAVDPAHAGPGDTVTMADGYPLLLATTGSLAELNARIAEDHPDDERKAAALPMERFRPNLVVDGTDAWAEDDWRRVRIGELTFRVVKPCGRCVVTTTDQETGVRRGPEPLRALGRHHRIGQKLIFGQNLIPERPEGFTGPLGTLHLGDELTVLEHA
ncbi:MOSC N-terminal beta barrel domain-containing protein [Kitasatospora sp. NPDC002040]|uniref:MOSC domain-containing protein n=1 Tax=Kitasatospora sp. NPDC002040 TaxID=3154661 RepID=UPI0033288E04